MEHINLLIQRISYMSLNVNAVSQFSHALTIKCIALHFVMFLQLKYHREQLRHRQSTRQHYIIIIFISGHK